VKPPEAESARLAAAAGGGDVVAYAYARRANGDGQVDRACEILHPVLVMLPAIESATIRSDIRQLARILARRWSGHPPVRDLMRELSAALTPPGAHAIVRPEARRS